MHVRIYTYMVYHVYTDHFLVTVFRVIIMHAWNTLIMTSVSLLLKLYPADTWRWPNVGTLLGRRRRRWANSGPTLDSDLLIYCYCHIGGVEHSIQVFIWHCMVDVTLSMLIMLTIKIEIFYIKSWNTFTYFVYFRSKEELRDSYIQIYESIEFRSFFLNLTLYMQLLTATYRGCLSIIDAHMFILGQIMNYITMITISRLIRISD